MIANDTKIEIDVVKEAIQNLLYADVLILVPIIQNSSMFVVNSNIVHYYSNQNMQAESIQFVSSYFISKNILIKFIFNLF